VPHAQLKPELHPKQFRLWPKQTRLLEYWEDRETTNIGFGGARGGAKSGGGRRAILYRRMKYDGSTGLILRRTYTDLYKSHISKLFEEFPGLQAGWRESHKELRLGNDSKLWFGSAEHEGDMTAFYSAEFGDVLVDEAQDFSQGELERLEGSNRSVSCPQMMSKMTYTFMPGFSESGIPPRGLSYLKRVFIENRLEPSEKKKSWKFIQAYAWDNVEWCRRELDRDHIDADIYYSWTDLERREYFLQSDYGMKLQAMTDEKLRDAWLFGSWDVFIGQYFPNFSRDRHVITKDQRLEKQRPWHRRWLSADWGFDHPHTCYKHSIDEFGRVITWGEMWGRQVSEQDMGKRITESCVGERFVAFPFSWDAGRQSPRSNRKTPRSIISLVNDALGPGIPKAFPADASPGSRISRARLTSQMLDSGHWLISEDCPRLIETMPTLLRDTTNTEDIRKVDWVDNHIGDDCYDGASMGLQFMCGASFKPAELRLREQAMAIEDETERFFFLYKESMKMREAEKRERTIPSWAARLEDQAVQ